MAQLPVIRLESEDWRALRRAHFFLEHPSLAARLTSVVGSPLEQAFALLPRGTYRRLQKGTHRAVGQALETAVYSLGSPARRRTGAQAGGQRLLGIGTGVAGGFFGLPGLLAELPVTTVLMLRSIATVAQSQGEDLTDPEARLACVQVFALGGRSHDDDHAEMGYFGVRTALAYHFSPVTYHLAKQGVGGVEIPFSVRLVSAVAGRFGVPVSEKAACQIVPVMGAGAGALINAIFFHHFQNVAWGHFTIRRLERRYGSERVQRWYRRMPDEAGARDELGP